MELKGLSLIGFGLGAPGGAPLTATNATTGEKLAPVFQSASAAEVEQAARLAAAAAPVYARTTGRARADFLRLAAQKIETAAPELATRGHAETALPLARCQSEIGRTVGQLRLFASVAEKGDWVDARIETAQPDRKPLPKPDHRSLYRPLGPVVVFGASNFPYAFSVAGGDTASALAVGCPVIVKAHSGHLGTSEMVGRLLVEAVRESGLPEGTFSLIFGSGSETGQALTRHPAVQAVGFTGSRKAGCALMAVAAARPQPIPVYAEMSSVNPVFVTPAAVKARSAALVDGLAASITLGVGQFCTNPGLLVVQAGAETDAFLKALGDKLAATPPAYMLTKGICQAYRHGVDERARAAGVSVLARAEAGPDGTAAAVLFSTPAANFLKSPALAEEIFGPSTLVIVCRDRAEMLAVAGTGEGQLTATIHAEPGEGIDDLVQLVTGRVGRVIMNGYPTGVEVSHAMVHGGPFPSTADGRSTSVGTRALYRFVRPVCYQGFPDAALPPALQNANPLGIWRLVNGELTKAAVA
jgi:NADP-dependent aldehyde dehydrogenase